MMNELNSKILNYILILFFAFVDCKTYAEEVNSWNELLRKGDIFFSKSSKLPFTGILKNYYPSGKLSLIDNFKNTYEFKKVQEVFEDAVFDDIES